MPPMKAVLVGQVYQDKRQRGPIPRQVKVVTVKGKLGNDFEFVAIVQNTITGRQVKISEGRLRDASRFSLVSEIGALAPVPQEAVPA